MYNENIMNEFYNPENYGVIKGASGVGKVVSDIGSEIIKIYIRVENDTVAEVTYQTFGGVVAIAATNVAVRLMQGKSIASLKKFTAQNILDVIGEVPETKMYIVQAVVNAVHGSLYSYENKSAKDD